MSTDLGWAANARFLLEQKGELTRLPAIFAMLMPTNRIVACDVAYLESLNLHVNCQRHILPVFPKFQICPKKLTPLAFRRYWSKTGQQLFALVPARDC